MGLFDFLKSKGGKSHQTWSEPRVSFSVERLGATPEEVAHAKKLFAKSIEQERATSPISMQEPDFLLDDYPFKNRRYVTQITVREIKGTGQYVEDTKRYYADTKAINALVVDIASVEFLLLNLKTAISLPILRTDVNKIFPIESINKSKIDNLCNNAAWMFINPYTPTGKKAKYPVEIYFSAYSYDTRGVMQGSHGVISYLQNGKIGKANEDFWSDHVHYHVTFKTVGKELVVNLIQYNDDPQKRPELLYHV